jgi:hypothetical protein
VIVECHERAVGHPAAVPTPQGLGALRDDSNDTPHQTAQGLRAQRAPSLGVVLDDLVE